MCSKFYVHFASHIISILRAVRKLHFESFLEMRVINKLLNRKCTVKNVYDCFYYKTSEISDDEVKRLVEDAAAEVYSELNAMKVKMDAIPRLKKKNYLKSVVGKRKLLYL